MRLPTLLLSTLLITAGLATASHAAQGVSLATGFTDFTTWSHFGSALSFNQTPGNGFTYSDLELTQTGQGGQAGAGFAPTTLTLDFDQAFSFDFHFFIPTNAGLRGDGLSFTLATAPGVGTGGSGLGYENLASASVAFAIDTFHFSGEPVSPSLQILQAGSVSPLAATETGLGDAIRDPNFQWYARVDYTPSGLGDQAGLLSGRIEHINLGVFTVAANVDFAALGMVGSPLYYGFTGANGLADDGHFVTSGVPVPEPSEWVLLGAGLAAVALMTRQQQQR